MENSRTGFTISKGDLVERHDGGIQGLNFREFQFDLDFLFYWLQFGPVEEHVTVKGELKATRKRSILTISLTF